MSAAAPFTIRVASPVEETPRVEQVRGIFDLAPEKESAVEWTVALPLNSPPDGKPWNIGLIVGPSGCGKSTIARHVWPTLWNRATALEWPAGLSVLDAFPESLPVKEITALLSSVGFSSPPAWLRPFAVLSTGQQFRVTLARLLAEGELVVFDEYTSVVDRTVARIGSAAVARTVRARGKQFVAVTCHEDVEAWLQPDWVYRPAERFFAWRLLQRRPPVRLRVFRASASAWPLFQQHHYLNHDLHGHWHALATIDGKPVAFSSWIAFFGGGPPTKREHRTVTLPDYQGVGIGNALSDHIASMWKALGYRAISTTTHPAMINARLRSPNWTMHRPPSLAGSGDTIKHASTRLTAGFLYVGPAMNEKQAKLLHSG